MSCCIMTQNKLIQIKTGETIDDIHVLYEAMCDGCYDKEIRSRSFESIIDVVEWWSENFEEEDSAPEYILVERIPYEPKDDPYASN